MRIAFTGGSGKAGRHVIPELLAHGHSVLNVDLVPLDVLGVDNLAADITDEGQILNAFTMRHNLGELDRRVGRSPVPDAVVHFAAIPRILLRPDCEAYRINTMGTYNVLEVAAKLGIRKVIFASSETTYGICFADGERKPEYLPIDEDHPVVPEDSYATSKVCNEVTARCFQRRTGADVYGLRINNVVEPHEYAQDFPRYFADPALRRRNIFAYIDARDLGQLVHRCLVTDGLGFQIFNAANNDHSVNLTTAELLARFYSGVPVRNQTGLGKFECLYSNAKAKAMLGWDEQHNWRKYIPDPRAPTCSERAGAAVEAGGGERPRRRRTQVTQHYASLRLDGRILRRRVRVYWSNEEKWFAGVVRDFDAVSELHCVLYDDGDLQWHAFNDPSTEWEYDDGAKAKEDETAGKRRIKGEEQQAAPAMREHVSRAAMQQQVAEEGCAASDSAVSGKRARTKVDPGPFIV
uniref:NAD-dependent epimerase/dehydratase domain-containing protein n=1 Tax=Calcidiscus leptoporus TaxID=127549 RepID=A0A7S0IQT0_9EUKA|mmetsp:Transcript_17912/g.41047  ORF Transcript_17912/g.41047 Transcript_17912/m.41047 type:complete len:464 (+) Transcript_17912:84-1475(+)|eukprot:CAMPEP_0119360668 /NCGR_PEP_ID=MMETSP1334-20130426/8201_1 /TAXON_ID=127549 /ORGANISM="Calcidiscus leptoporus, Strain RCC1130" /LENGTH=463 /DNA_ID=CAMNT_0007375535 /DNA_START=84 /DNA_END=1475 /DNA_ORIENTATION=-